MPSSPPNLFPDQGTTEEVESGDIFTPKFGADGLMPAIVTDRASGEVLMLAWMNAEALKLTIDTGVAHFWTRSRRRIWKKGEESGNVLRVIGMRTDCDQDAIVLQVKVEGAGVTCHTGCRSCFYRALKTDRPDEISHKISLAPVPED